MVVNRRWRGVPRGLTLVELVFAVAAGAVLLLALNSLVKLGTDAQTAGRSANELAYQGRFALERIVGRARTVPPKELAAPPANTTGNWFAPSGCTGGACLMYCLNSSAQLIETIVSDVSCTGTSVVARNVTAFAAQVPAGAGAVDRYGGTVSLTLTDGSTTTALSATVRLGGGTQ